MEPMYHVCLFGMSYAGVVTTVEALCSKAKAAKRAGELARVGRWFLIKTPDGSIVDFSMGMH